MVRYKDIRQLEQLLLIRKLAVYLLIQKYLIDTTYDELGRTASIIYPDNETVYYDYDNGGNLTSVSGYATFSNFNAFGTIAKHNL